MGRISTNVVVGSESRIPPHQLNGTLRGLLFSTIFFVAFLRLTFDARRDRRRFCPQIDADVIDRDDNALRVYEGTLSLLAASLSHRRGVNPGVLGAGELAGFDDATLHHGDEAAAIFQ